MAQVHAKQQPADDVNNAVTHARFEQACNQRIGIMHHNAVNFGRQHGFIIKLNDVIKIPKVNDEENQNQST